MGDATTGRNRGARAGWAARLRAGEPVWLYRQAGAYVSAILTTLLAAGFLHPAVRIAVLWLSGHPEVVRRDYNLSAYAISVWLFVLALTAFCAVLMWRLLLRARVRFTATQVEYPSWSGRLERRELLDIVAAGVFTRFARRGGARHELRACQLTPGTGGGSRWVGICGAFVGVRLGIAQAVLAEMSRRCELTELSPTSGRYGAEIWQRPGHETDIPPAE